MMFKTCLGQFIIDVLDYILTFPFNNLARPGVYTVQLRQEILRMRYFQGGIDCNKLLAIGPINSLFSESDEFCSEGYIRRNFYCKNPIFLILYKETSPKYK
jgi:hypothetical protein